MTLGTNIGMSVTGRVRDSHGRASTIRSDPSLAHLFGPSFHCSGTRTMASVSQNTDGDR